MIVSVSNECDFESNIELDLNDFMNESLKS
jgi:hypothetical protein